MHVGVLEDDVDQQALIRLWLVSAQYTCTMSAMAEGKVSHDQVRRTVRSLARDDGVLIFNGTIPQKNFTDESDLMCWHFDHCSGRTVRGVNLQPS